MFHRLLKPTQKHSFFLFGPRGSGKSTLVGSIFPASQTLSIDLLDPVMEDLFHRDPLELDRRIAALPPSVRWVFIDEVQKAPRLLNLVHRSIEQKGRPFILTGSSPRKLMRGAANLLAGRAFVYHLHPLTHLELGPSFDLSAVLRWGSLPKIFQLSSGEEKARFLQAYALTYLKEEIAVEQLVRRLDPFRNFLPIAAQCNGQVLNYTRIAEDIGVDVKTVQSYFSVLEDTLLGFHLPAYHRSLRKSHKGHPKFYLFDPGVKRALDRTLTQELYPKTYAFGAAFEHFMILECRRLNDYFRKDFAFSHLRTKDGAEVDLVVDRPGRPPVLVEFKSSDHVKDRDITHLSRFQADMPGSKALCLSLDPHPKKIGDVLCLPWMEGLREIGLAPS